MMPGAEREVRENTDPAPYGAGSVFSRTSRSANFLQKVQKNGPHEGLSLVLLHRGRRGIYTQICILHRQRRVGRRNSWERAGSIEIAAQFKGIHRVGGAFKGCYQAAIGYRTTDIGKRWGIIRHG